jgi:acyl-CoA thioesterase FadM
MAERPIPRIQYDGEFFYETKIPIRFFDFNAGRHLSNDAALRFVTEAHQLFLSEKKLALDNVNGTSIAFAGVSINFLKEVLLKDFNENTFLNVKLGLFQVSKTRLCFYQEHRNEAGEICHKMLVDIVYFDNETGKVAKTDNVVNVYN